MDQTDKEELHAFLVEDKRRRCEKQDNCEHQFVHDLIDIDPDRSMEIVYCELCEKIQK